MNTTDAYHSVLQYENINLVWLLILGIFFWSFRPSQYAFCRAEGYTLLRACWKEGCRTVLK